MLTSTPKVVTITFRLSLSSVTLLICDDTSESVFNVGTLDVGTLDGLVGQSVIGVGRSGVVVGQSAMVGGQDGHWIVESSVGSGSPCICVVVGHVSRKLSSLVQISGPMLAQLTSNLFICLLNEPSRIKSRQSTSSIRASIVCSKIDCAEHILRVHNLVLSVYTFCHHSHIILHKESTVKPIPSCASDFIHLSASIQNTKSTIFSFITLI